MRATCVDALATALYWTATRPSALTALVNHLMDTIIKAVCLIALAIRGPRIQWYSPITLEHLLSLKKEHADSRIVVGNTEIGN